MNLRFLLLILPFSALPALGQKMAPFGTILLKGNIYIDKFLVTNINYAEFLWSIESRWSPRFSDSIQQFPTFAPELRNIYPKGINQPIAPDTGFIAGMVIKKTFYETADTTVSLKKYLADSKIRNLPVLGLSYQQAAAFCKWRTDMVRLNYSRFHVEDSTKYFSKLLYRLPTEEEWQLATKGKISTLKRYVVYSEYPTSSRFIVYDKILSELTSKENILIRFDNDTKTGKRVIGNSPTWIGFRCVCETME
jgi:formylglycine-generating enzyme required for sulfatase activity